jgi:hypothetical protein
MPIISWNQSTKRTLAFKAALKQLSQLKGIPSNLTIYPPLPLYDVGLRDAIRSSSSLDTSGKLVGWRYFAGGRSEGTAVSGDMDLSSVPKVTSLSYGEPVLLALEAIQKAASLPDLANAQFEPRLLRIPGLLLECLWLTPIQAPTAEPASAGAPGWVFPYHKLINALPPQAEAEAFYRQIFPYVELAFRKGFPPSAPAPIQAKRDDQPKP